jgi:2-keto-4-pentenoate hydratase/2-oxohepta-3-ene-1,7-dioic acid hydratase in catechol pathway
MYQHRYADGAVCELPAGKVVCVGRNYAEHAKELGNAVPAEPILFIKPRTAVTSLLEQVRVPQGQGACHFETEIAVLIGNTLTHADEETVRAAIAGIGLGLDLTLRDVQDVLKAKGLPWEKAKSFDGACPLSPFVRLQQVADLANLRLRLQVNGETRQDGNSSDMLTPVLPLLVYMSRHFTLEPGDVVMTGTPRGVGPLLAGDALRVMLGEDLLVVETRAV